jgi:signal transduction histidine kinase
MATIVAVTAFGVVLFAVPMAVALRQRSQQTDVEELRRLAVRAAHRLPADFSTPGAVSGAALGDAENHRYALYAPNGRRLAGTGPDPGDAVVAQAVQRVMADGRSGDELAVAYAVGSGGNTSAVVRVSEPVAEGRHRLRTALLGLGLLAALAAAAAAAAGWLLVRLMTRPLDRLRRSAQALGDGDFTVTPAPTGLPELDDVGTALGLAARRIGNLVERERTFSADASHQLRTPIAGLRVALETELIHPRPAREPILREGLAAVERLEGTVDSLLRLARDVHDDRGELQLPAVINELSVRWRPAVLASGRTLVARSAPGLPTVRASATAIGHVLDVLVDNALRHGGGTITVDAASTSAGVVVTVTDEGPGVADPERLFQRRPGGSGNGIGLALGRTLAAAEGGHLRLRTARPAIFELTLAANEGPSPGRPADRESAGGREKAAGDVSGA